MSFLFFLLFGAIAIALRSEAVQTRLVGWLAEKASERLGYRCSIGGFYLDWVDFARATRVQVLDPEGNPMIRVQEIKINLKLMDLLEKNINLDLVGLSGGLVEVRRSKKTGKINMTGFSDAILDWVNGTDTTRSLHPPVFSIDQVRLEGMTFAYIDETEAPLPGQFDYYHFHLDGICGVINNFWQRRDSIRLQTENLVATDRGSGLEVKSLSARFGLTSQDMFLKNLHAEIGGSVLRDSLGFRFLSWDDFSNFNHAVELSANLRNSIIQSNDLALFAPALKGLNEVYSVSGEISGTVDNFRWKQMELKSENNTRIQGSLNMRGLPDAGQTFTDLRLKNSSINPSDLTFFTGKQAAGYLGMLGNFSVSGSFIGFFRNFVSKSTFSTSLGTIITDMQMELPEDPSLKSSYQGHLKTIAFDLGKVLNKKDIIQKIDFDGRFEGKGFNPDNAEASVKARISRLGVLGYDYRNIETDARFSKKSFDGLLSVRDPHLIFTGKGRLDLSKGVEVADIEANLAKANFMPLKITADPLDLSTEVSLHFKGFDFDEFSGNATIKNLRVLLRDERMDLDEAHLESSTEKGEKTFSLNTPLADIRLKGSFKYRKLLDDAIGMFREYERLIRNQGLVNQEDYIARRKSEALPYSVESSIRLKDINRLLDLVDFPLTVTPGTEIETAIQFGQSELFNLRTEIDSIRYRDIVFYNTSFDLNSSKTLERPDVIANLSFASASQSWNNSFKSEKLMLDADWEKGQIIFKLNGKEQGSQNSGNINGEVAFEPFSTLLKIRNSSVNFYEQVWNFSDSNTVVISDTGSIRFNRMELQNGSQSLALSGVYNGNSSDSIVVLAKNIRLEELKKLTGEDLSGLVNGKVSIRQLEKNPLFEGKLSARGLGFRQYPIGDFEGTATWNQSQKNLEIDGNLLREGSQLFSLKGFYTPDLPDPLDMDVRVQRLGIDFLQSIIGNSVSNMRGWASGNLRVGGDFSRPILNGNLLVKDGQVKINYLNTTYFFSPKVTFTAGEISADGAVLTDENGKTGILSRAALKHRNFEDFRVDLNSELSNFQVFNIPKSAGEVYFGTGICTGSMQISGSFDEISISARARTNKGTRLFIPLDMASKEDIGESFISFNEKHPETRAARKDSIRKINLSGIRMDFDLEVTEDAYGEIIFDQKAGDIIRATGNGKIKLAIDTRGEFSVIGQYAIKKGDYHFTTYNLVNKDFDIRPGSTITWNGPVLNGVMDILAEYNLNASLAPLASGDEQIQQRPEAKRRYPVLVSMRLTDQLLKPVISLGLDIRDYPKNSDLNYYVQAFLTRITTDEQELNRQVFSLMIFRMFAPMGEFTRTAGISYSSFSDLVSNQLSSWLSQFDENLEVSVDLSGLSQADLNNFQLRFSYTMLDGRLRLTRDGGFTNAQNQTSALSIAGDWTLEYMLSKNGIFRVKMFHRINQNLILSGLNTNNTTQGASLLHTQSFNHPGELFPRKKKRETRKPEPARKPENNPESAATLPEIRIKP